MEQMTPMAVIRLMPATGSQQKDFTLQLLQMVMSGEVNPLEMEVYLKSIEDVVKNVRKDAGFKDATQDEVAKYPGKEFRYGNALIVKSSRTVCNYSEDSEWQGLDQAKKTREKFLKGLDKPMADPETGEITSPPTRKTTEFLKIRYDDFNEVKE